MSNSENAMPTVTSIWRIARWPLVAAAALGLRALLVTFVGDGHVAQMRIWSDSDAGCRGSFTRNRGFLANSTMANTPCNSTREFDDHFSLRCYCPMSP